MKKILASKKSQHVGQVIVINKGNQQQYGNQQHKAQAPLRGQDKDAPMI